MKIVKIIKKKSNIYEILLSDNTSLSFYSDTIVKFNLLCKKELDNKEILNMQSFNKNLEAYYHALKLINVKLRTKGEIEKKLKSLNYSSDAIEIAINRLEKEGYLNNNLYIKSYINDAINLSLKGPNKIMLELTNLGFSKDEILSILEETEEKVWQMKVDKIINKKVSSNHKLSNKMLINKLKNDLYNMGYEKSLIDNSLNNLKLSNDTIILEKEIQKEIRKLSHKFDGQALKSKLKSNLYKKGYDLSQIEEILNKEII